jgi:hypothetical protein
MHLALREFGDRLDRQGTGVFYFAGHGMQVRGRNYLIPVDADIAREDEVAFSALDLAAVMEKLDSAKNPVNIVILDACRNNPFGGRVAVTSRGLAPIDAPPGTLIAFATAPGSTAADGSGRNGLYTQHLVKAIDRPGAAIEEVFKQVRAGVRADSKSQQIPWESTSLETSFHFRAPPPPKAEPPPARTAAAAASASRSAVPVSAPPTFVVGDRWRYDIHNKMDGGKRSWNGRVTEIKGDDVFYSNGNISDLVGNTTRSNRRDGGFETFNPSAQSYLFPMRVGNSWDLKYIQHITEAAGKERTHDVAVKLRVVGEEEVDLPGGRVKAMRVERVAQWKQRNSESSGTRAQTFWYSGPVKRWVRMEDRSTLASGKIILHELWELVSYEVK